MHEHIIINKILNEAESHGAKKSIQLEVGELSDISPKELEQSLKPLTNLKIKIIHKQSKIKCSCGYEGRAKILDKGHGYCMFICPQCENTKPSVLEGGEIRLTGVN